MIDIKKITNVWYGGVLEILDSNSYFKFIAIDTIEYYNPSNHQYYTEVKGRFIDKLFEDHAYANQISEQALHELIEKIPKISINLSAEVKFLVYR